MGFLLNGSTLVGRNVGGTPVLLNSYPYSIFCRAHHVDLLTEGYPFGFSFNGVADDDVQLGFRGDLANDPVHLRRGKAGGTTTIAYSGTPYVAGVWTSLGAYSTDSSTFGFYQDGVHTAGVGTT